MPRPLISRGSRGARRARPPLVAALALLLALALPVPAWPATGDVMLSAISESGGHAFFSVRDPQNNVCYDIRDKEKFEIDQRSDLTYVNFSMAINNTDTPLVVYQGDNCSGNAGATVAPGSREHGNFKSFRLG